MGIKAVIFDIGGVVVGSPLLGVAKYEKKHGLPSQYLNVAITAKGKDGAFQKLETGKIKIRDFYDEFGRDLSDTKTNNAVYKRYCERLGQNCPPLPQSLHIDGKKLWKVMMQEAVRPDMSMITAISSLRRSGNYKVAALTNNFEKPPDAKEDDDDALGSASDMLRSMFDHFIESAKLGMRKPDPKFFQHALDVLGIKAEEALFLDDIGINLKAAQKLGMNTIRVDIYDSGPAIAKLQEAVPDVDLSEAQGEARPKL